MPAEFLRGVENLNGTLWFKIPLNRKSGGDLEQRTHSPGYCGMIRMTFRSLDEDDEMNP